jgi:adenine-specific DNA-methyltransferase
VYADPPYTRDHYSRYYHVLETMARRDNPEIELMSKGRRGRISRGLYRSDRHQSPFCIASQAAGAFAELFRGVRRLNVPLILSYSPYELGTGARPRLLSIDAVCELASQTFPHVTVRRFDIVHSKFNASEQNVAAPSQAEALIVCE